MAAYRSVLWDPKPDSAITGARGKEVPCAGEVNRQNALAVSVKPARADLFGIREGTKKKKPEK